MQKMKRYGMGASVPAGMKMTKAAKDTAVLRMMNDAADARRAKQYAAGGAVMMNLNADADVTTDTCVAGPGGKCKKSKKYKRKQNRANKKRIRRSRN